MVARQRSSMEATNQVLNRLSSRGDFESFRSQAEVRWQQLWEGKQTVLSVGVGSSSLAKGALDVLAACERLAAGRSDVVARQTAVDGADWMEVQVQVKRPGQPVVYYGDVLPTD